MTNLIQITVPTTTSGCDNESAMAMTQATGMTQTLRSIEATIAMEAGSEIESPSKHFSAIIHKVASAAMHAAAAACFTSTTPKDSTLSYCIAIAQSRRHGPYREESYARVLTALPACHVSRT
jgi:hypothetical protein